MFLNLVNISCSEQVNGIDSNIMSKLASVQMELVAAMSKRTENLQIYMQVKKFKYFFCFNFFYNNFISEFTFKELMHEAERVVSTNNTSPNSKISPFHVKNNDSPKENVKVNNELASNHLSEELAHKDNVIHDLEVRKYKYCEIIL